MGEFNKLIISKEQITASIIDEEGDDLNLTFNYDNCVEVNTSKYTYLALSVENLETLIRLICEADDKYKEMFKP